MNFKKNKKIEKKIISPPTNGREFHYMYYYQINFIIRREKDVSPSYLFLHFKSVFEKT